MSGASTLVDILETSARAFPERSLHFNGSGHVSYRALPAAARRYATALRALGVTRGSCVGLLVGTSVDFVVSFFGALVAGAAVAPLALPRGFHEADSLKARLERLAPALDLVVLEPVLAARLEASGFSATRFTTPAWLAEHATDAAAAAPPDPEDLAVIQYTSGSTSEPRGVALTHANVVAGCTAIADGMKLSERDVFGAWLPLFHDMGLVGMLSGMLRGVEQYHTSPAAFVKDPAGWLERFAARRSTIFTGPNFAYEQLLLRVPEAELARLDLSSWRVAFNGGEPIDPVCLAGFVQRFATSGFPPASMIPCYGLAEATLAVTFDDFEQAPRSEWVERSLLANAGLALPSARPDSSDRKGIVCVGRPVPGMELAIRREDGSACAEREVGEIAIRGASVTRGYYRNPTANAQAFQAGFLRTGDLGYLHAGELYVTGRRRQMLIVRGENYYPEDIEAAVRATPGLYQQRCVAVKVDDGAERVCLLAEAKAVTDASDLEQRLRRVALAEFPALELDVRVVAPRTLQQTSSGKFQRVLMSELLRQGALEPRRAAGAPASPQAREQA